MRNIHTLLRQTLGALPLMAVLSVQAAPDYGVSEGNEELLIQGLESLASQQFDDALTQFQELTQKRPDFRLAQLVYADLLAAQANPLGEAGGDQAQRKKQIQGLIDEARARLTYKETRRQGLVPKSLVQMSDNQKYLILVDTDLSRLFLFENVNGTPTLVKDYYASYGRGGTEKRKQGDLKTPLGVYFVTMRYQDRNLPERYGSGALPINYPNQWDYRLGHTGNGIWVHGSPVDTYSRPPKASEGCISLTNPDFIELDKLVDIKNTPVLIGKSVEWVSVDQWKKQKGQLATFIDQWRQDWESKDHSRYISHYSKTYKDGSRNYDSFSAYKERVNSAKEYIKVGIDDLSLFTYPNNPDLMVATFRQDYQSNNYKGESIKRQYWVREQGEWKIAFEGDPSKGIP
jgi:murein L,D-transpeptidase YafK